MPRKSEKQTDLLPDGSILDLDSYDWEGINLTRKQKLFIVWYTLPGQKGYMNPTTAALKAGYKPKSAYRAKIEIITLDKVATLIEKFTNDFVKTAVKEAARKALDLKLRRAGYNTKDFYQTKTFTLESGDTVERMAVIPIDEIDSDNAVLIDNVEINNQGIPTYKLPNREKEINEIIKLNAEMNEDKSTGEYDVETTVDLVKENLATVKTTIRLNNEKVKAAAENYIENSENQPDFD